MLLSIMRCANIELSFLTILLFSTIETRSLRPSFGGKASQENQKSMKSSEKLHVGVGLLQEEKLESENLSAKTSLEGTMKMVGLVGEELEGVVQAWENLLPDILACYASLSGGE